MNNTEISEKIKVLLLDDGADFRKMTEERLLQRGFPVVCSTNDPHEAVDAIRTPRPDIVLFDIILAKIDGIAFLKEAMRLPTDKPVSYIAVSNVTNEMIVKEVFTSGATYFMVKPLDFDVLSERLFQICGRRSVPVTNRVSAIPTVSVQNEDLEKQITAIILEIGIPAHVKGYHYVRAAILLATQSPDTINAVTKVIYPTIAKQYQTSSSRVERAIRHAIEVAWDRGNIDTLNAIFGYSVNSNRGKPTNSEFIAMIADRLRLKNKDSSAFSTLSR